MSNKSIQSSLGYFEYDWQNDPRIMRIMAEARQKASQPDPLHPDQIILHGSKTELPDDLDNDTLQRAFARAMYQGVSTDENGTPHFFRPKSFLQHSGRKLFRHKLKIKDYAAGLSSIVQAKNQPQFTNNPDIQQAAKTAIDEYLDPKLFDFNLSRDTELIEIYAELDQGVRGDPLLNQCLIDSDREREEIKKQYEERAKKAARASQYEDYSSYANRREPDFNAPHIWRDASLEQVHNILEYTSNPIAAERINALNKWSEFIKQNIPNAELETEFVSFNTPKPPISGQYSWPADDNTYAVATFNYAGKRCMIAECCGPDRSKDQGSAGAMKIWRGELDDRDGWRQIFKYSKKEASEKNLCQDIIHVDLAKSVNERPSNDKRHITEAEDQMFRAAIHYFETGELVGSGKAATTKLDNLIGPEFRRPNF